VSNSPGELLRRWT